ncbi:MAG: class I SAM-dependent methyltransferase [Patescibacteria group bacterium]
MKETFSSHVEMPAPKRHGIKETLMRAVTRGPVDKALTQRAEWMVEELKVGRYLAPKITYKEPGVLKPNNVEKGVTVVSIGSGKGHEMDEMDMILPGSNVIGLDPDDYMTKPVSERLRTLAHNAEYLQEHNRAEHMADIVDASADGVTFNFVLHDIDAARHDRIFDEVKRVLKKDGYLFIAEDLVDSKQEKVVAEREDRKLNIDLSTKSPQNYRSATEWEAFFQKHGFEVVENHEVKPGKVRHGFFVLRKIAEKT